MTERKPEGPFVMKPVYKDIDSPEEPPRVAHMVNFNRIGTDVLMTIGFIDVAKLAMTLERVKKGDEDAGEESEFEVKVYARFAMSPDAFARLTANAQQIYNAMLQTGQISTDDREEDT